MNCGLVYTGGLWMWEDSTCELDRVQLQGGSSYVLFIHKDARANLKVSYTA